MRPTSRFIRTQEYIFVWPGDELKPIGYDGNVFNMPPHDQVAEVSSGKPWSHPAAVGGDGKPIPGTIIVHDRYADNEAGGTERALDAAEFCRWIETTLPELLNQGFAIVMSPDDVQPAMDLGRPKYEASRDHYAREIITHELERLKSAETTGIPPQMSQSNHKIQWAAAHLRNSQAQNRSQMLSSGELRNVLLGGPESPPAPKEETAGPPSGAEQVAAVEPREVFEQAMAAGINLTKAQMAQLLRGDVKYAGVLLEQIAEKQEAERITA